jgi:hypothetical protein
MVEAILKALIGLGRSWTGLHMRLPNCRTTCVNASHKEGLRKMNWSKAWAGAFTVTFMPFSLNLEPSPCDAAAGRGKNTAWDDVSVRK